MAHPLHTLRVKKDFFFPLFCESYIYTTVLQPPPNYPTPSQLTKHAGSVSQSQCVANHLDLQVTIIIASSSSSFCSRRGGGAEQQMQP